MNYLTKQDKTKLEELGLGHVFETIYDTPRDFFKANQLNWESSDKSTFMRDMTEYEKNDLRETYKEELEENQPALLEMYKTAQAVLAEAKQNLKNVEQQLSDSTEILRNTAYEIKSGRISQDLKEENLTRVVFRNHWIYLLFNPSIKLFQIIHVREMNEDDKLKWYNDASYIEDFDFTSVFHTEAEVVDDDEEDIVETEDETCEPLALGSGQPSLVASSMSDQEVESQAI